MTWLQRLKAARGTDTHSRRTDETDETDRIPRFVSFVSGPQTDIPASEGEGRERAADDDREAFEERAAIMEYDGGLSRAEAERLAAAAKSVAGDGLGKSKIPSSLNCLSTPCADGERAGGIGKEAHSVDAWPLGAWGDMRPCTRCRNLTRSGRCMAAWRGELRGARDYEPSIPKQPRRCIGYSPPADDPDQRPGRARWPEMVEWQALPLAWLPTYLKKTL